MPKDILKWTKKEVTDGFISLFKEKEEYREAVNKLTGNHRYRGLTLEEACNDFIELHPDKGFEKAGNRPLAAACVTVLGSSGTDA